MLNSLQNPMPSYPIKGGWVKLDRQDAALLCAAHWSIVRGYVQGTISGKRVLLHRLVLGLSEDDPLVDHRDLDGLNNKRKNLRVATKSQNGHNRLKRADNTSGYKGVYLCRSTGRWRAATQAEGARHKLGRFDDPESAARAYDTAALRLHGEFARTNF
jgi:hypothetical protein